MNEIQVFSSATDLKKVLAGEYQKQITNYFGDEKKSLKFLSAVVSAVQRNPTLLTCTPVSVINSFLTMAQLELMPSDISGEAYVIPYSNNKKTENGGWEKIMEAQFQLGYQGLVTLFFRAGVKRIIAEIVYEKDYFEYINGEVRHKPDVFADDRGKAVGAYVIVKLGTEAEVSKAMSAREILEIGERFSKSFSTERSPWKEKNDPQLWMWRKTVLKQVAKLVPKNEKLVRAIAEDNSDSVISDRKEIPAAPSRLSESYEVRRAVPPSEDESTGGNSKMAERMEEAEKIVTETSSETPVTDEKSQRLEIANLLKKKHKFTMLGKDEQAISEKIMSITGIKYMPENYAAIIEDLNS